MLGSNSPSAWVTPMLRASFALVVLSVLSACSSSQLQLESTLPRPLIDRIELPVGVYMDEPFRTFSAAEEIPQHGTVSLSAGAINQELFNRVLPGLFTDVRTLDKPIADKPIPDKPGAGDVRDLSLVGGVNVSAAVAVIVVWLCQRQGLSLNSSGKSC